MDLWVVRNELSQDSAETQRLLAKRRPRPVTAGSSCVPFVEDQVGNLEHRRQTGGKFLSTRHLERHSIFGERPLCADDALGNRRLRDKICPRDLRSCQTAKQAQRERDAPLGRKNRMTRGEDQPQEIVAGAVVVRHPLLTFMLVSEFLV